MTYDTIRLPGLCPAMTVHFIVIPEIPTQESLITHKIVASSTAMTVEIQVRQYQVISCHFPA